MLQQCGFARSRTAHQVNRKNIAAFEPFAVALRDPIVPGQDILLQPNRAMSGFMLRTCLRMSPIAVMVPAFVRMAVLVLVRMLRGPIGRLAAEIRDRRFGLFGASTGATHRLSPRFEF